MHDYNLVEILLVEDNLYDVELTLHALKKNNLTNKIYTVNDGEKALDFIFCRGAFTDREQRKNPKLILLDLKLPKVNGLEVLEAIKKNEDTKAIPVVVLTSSREERDMIDTYKLGVNSYITKPVDFDKFTDAVREIGLYWLLINQLPEKSK